MSYPVRTIERSSLLNGQTNGKLEARLLVSVPGIQGGPTVKLLAPSARKWNAMAMQALAEGVVLKAAGPADSYRPYAVQEAIFRARYTTTYLAGRPYKVWLGQRWYLRPGMATAAIPGTSNHGWAGAVDTGTETDGDPSAESLNDKALGWLLHNALDFGWSWELQSEPWHLHDYTGDAIPTRVKAWERAHSPAATTTIPVTKIASRTRTHFDLSMPDLAPGDQGGPVWHLQNLLNDHAGEKLALTGRYDKATATAVNRLKKTLGLPLDRICGGQVWHHLLDATVGPRQVKPQ